MNQLERAFKRFGTLNFLAGLIWLICIGRPRRLTTPPISEEVIFFGYVGGRGDVRTYWGEVFAKLGERRASTYIVLDDYKSVEGLDPQARLRSNQISIRIWLKSIRAYFAATQRASSPLFAAIRSEFGHKQLAEQVLFWILLELIFHRNEGPNKPWKFVYCMEGLPWEWTLVHFAKIQGIETLGFPHSVVNMCQTPIRRQALVAPQLSPDSIATSGPLIEAALEEIGFSTASFRRVEATRFQVSAKRPDLKKNLGSFSLGDRHFELVLCHIPERAHELLSHLQTTFGACRDVTLDLRFHPGMPVKSRTQVKVQAQSLGFALGTFDDGTKLVDSLSSAWVNTLVSTGSVNLWDPGLRCWSFLYRDPSRFGLNFRRLGTEIVHLSFLDPSEESREKFLCLDQDTKRWMSIF